MKPSTNKSAHSSLDKNFSSEKSKRNKFFLSAAGIPSSEFSYSPFMQKKKVVAHQGDCLLLGDNNAFDGYLKQDDNLHRYKPSDVMDNSVYQPEPCLQRKKITLYKKNHNILCTYTTKEFNDPDVLPVLSSDALAEPSFQNRRKYFENNYSSEKDGRHHVSKTCLDLEVRLRLMLIPYYFNTFYLIFYLFRSGKFQSLAQYNLRKHVFSNYIELEVKLILF